MTLDRAHLLEALPQYELEGELGHGAWGVVLAGRHRQLNRRVAIKKLPSVFANDPEVRQRFQREARVLASLEHTNIVTVYDYVEHDGNCFIVMELLPGGSLSKRSQIKGLTLNAACAVALASSNGLRVAHARNILHRDIKPENLLFSSKGAIKVTDFGLAKIVSGDQTLITQAGFVLGTPAYMAPEQALGEELTPATDVYSLATVLYELIATRLPYPSSRDALAILHSHAFDPPTPLIEHVPGLPLILHEVVMKGIANDPTKRWPTAAEFGAALNEATASVWGSTWRAFPETAEILGGESDINQASDGKSQSPRQLVNIAETFEDAKQSAGTMVVQKTPPVSSSEPTLTSEDDDASTSLVAPDFVHRTTEVSPSQASEIKTVTSALARLPRLTPRRKLFWGAALVLLLVLAVAVWAMVSHLTGASSLGAVLPSGEKLQPGQELTSPNGHYTLRMQSDGNLVEYGRMDPIWATGTSGNNGAYALVQPAGNLVIYPKGEGPPSPDSPTTPALWASSTAPQVYGVYLQLDNGGHIRLLVPHSNVIAWEATP
jgi:serine/threonine protein kinase